MYSQCVILILYFVDEIMIMNANTINKKIKVKIWASFNVFVYRFCIFFCTSGSYVINAMSNGVTDLGTDIESLDQTPKPMTTLVPNSVIVKASTDGILNMQSAVLIPDEDAQNTGFSFSASKAAFLLHSMVLSLFPHCKLLTYVFFRRIYFTVIFNSSYLLLVYTTSYSLFFYFSEIIYFPLIFSFQKIRVFIIFYVFLHYFNEIKFFLFCFRER